jgi:hypothetical protein
MLAARIDNSISNFGVEFADYGRQSTGILLSSGCGIGMALMDVCLELNYFVDIDSYRFKPVDWESLMVTLSVAKPQVIVLAGWYTIDRPLSMEAAARGCIDKNSLVWYEGGKKDLSEAIAEIHRFI